MVVGFHVTEQSGLQFSRAAVDAATQLPFRQGGEPTLHQVDPGRPGGGKVQVVTRMAHQPTLNRGGLVRAIVVQNQMHVQFGGLCCDSLCASLSSMFLTAAFSWLFMDVFLLVSRALLALHLPLPVPS